MKRPSAFCLLLTAFCLLLSGCQPPINLIPVPAPQPAPKAEPVTVKLVIDGEGKINVGGGAEITAKSASPSADSRCPCGCGKDGCTCSSSSAAPTVSTSARSAPQVIASPQTVPQTVKVYQCRNGVCGWYDVSAVSGQRSVVRNGKVTIFARDSPACLAMRTALRDAKGIDFDQGTPPPVNGTRWWPTAVKPDGSTWTPGAAGWHAGSLAEFLNWKGP